MERLKWRSRHRLLMGDAMHIKVHRDGANPAGSLAAQAMGRTKGGLNTKLHALSDDRARPQALTLTAGQQADVSHAPGLLERAESRHVIMDRGYDSDSLRALIAAKAMNDGVFRGSSQCRITCQPPRPCRPAST